MMRPPLLSPSLVLALLVGCDAASDTPPDEPACPLASPADDAEAAGEEALVAPVLSPELPACVGYRGPDSCWGEWLKELDAVPFAPVARGGLGAGPWPLDAARLLGAAAGVTEPLLGVGVDTGENQYAVSAGALYVRRAGAALFERHARNTDGLRDFPLLSVAGGGPGVAYVGYVGVVTATEFNDPPAVARSGDVQRIDLVPGGLVATTWDTHSSNCFFSGRYDHMRTINDIVVPRRGPAAGEVYVASEHAVTRYQGRFYADHRHVSVSYGGSSHYGAARALTVGDDGTMWYGSDFLLGGLAWTPRRYEWYFASRWIAPTNAYGTDAERDYYEGVGVDSRGGVWAAARTHGLVHLTPRTRAVERLEAPDLAMTDLAVDLDDSVWVAAKGGLFRYQPSARAWSRLGAAGTGVKDLFLDDTVVPRALYAATSGGILMYRGP